ncbi:MAG: VanZ family protein [Bacteroidales bacterium]|nr:VanZ family protein [Bacteroidales bacterium]
MVKKQQKIYKILFSLWTIIIFITILMPKSELELQPIPIHIPHFDKFVHICLFGVFMFFLCKVTELKTSAKFKLYILSISISCFLGILTEIIQGLLETYIQRSFSWWDFLADCIGTAIALIIYICFSKR